MHILIVDDYADTLDLLAQVFIYAGHTVDIARTGQEAVRIASSLSHDVIVMDILLPDIDGYSAAREIRKRYLYRTPNQIIALSGTAFDPAHPHAGEARFDAYLTKPVNIDQLIAVIEKRPSATWRRSII